MNEFRHQMLYDTWVIIAPNRAKRPAFSPGSPPPAAINDPFIHGQEQRTPPEIYAVRENPRITASWLTRVFANRFPLLKLEAPLKRAKRGFYSIIGGFGAHEMVIDHPKATTHLCHFDQKNLRALYQSFRDRIEALSKDGRIAHIHAFKNQGMKAGNTIPHSHSQIVALPFIPPATERIIDASRRHYNHHERCLVCDMLESEEADQSRILYRNRHFLVFAPFAPRFEFEVWIVPLSHESHFEQLSSDALGDLAEASEWILGRLALALEDPDLNLTLVSAPPKRPHPKPNYFHHLEHFFHWHVAIVPRFEARDGFELSSGCYINPTPPEEYAHFLRELPAPPEKG